MGIGIISGLLLVVFPKLNRKVGFGGLVLGVLLVGAAGIIAFLPDGNAQSPPVVNQGPGSAYSFGQQGGITAGTVNIGPTKRSLSDSRTEPLKTQMLSELPRDKPITVIGLLGDSESVGFATEIHAFLKGNGYNMREPGGISQSVFTPLPKGLIRDDKPDGSIELIIGTP